MAIRASRRGAVVTALLLWPLTVLATMTTPDIDPTTVVWAILAAALTWPGLALLGAGLAPTTLGSRVDAAAAGVALAIGAPVAAVASIVIGAAVVALYPGTPGTGEAVGIAIRLGVFGALRIAPLLGLAAVAWVLILRRTMLVPPPAEVPPRGDPPGHR